MVTAITVLSLLLACMAVVFAFGLKLINRLSEEIKYQEEIIEAKNDALKYYLEDYQQLLDTYEEKADELSKWSSGVLEDLKNGTSQDPIGRALVDTAKRFEIPHQHFVDFLHSMTMDLTVCEYQSYEDLLEYVYGSAAVIGLEMVPVLGFSDQAAFECAKKLGIAFQLANFIRDVSEDLDRGRVYLPLDESLPARKEAFARLYSDRMPSLPFAAMQ
jgi:phytoene/squalene synthetase